MLTKLLTFHTHPVGSSEYLAYFRGCQFIHSDWVKSCLSVQKKKQNKQKQKQKQKQPDKN